MIDRMFYGETYSFNFDLGIYIGNKKVLFKPEDWRKPSAYI